MTRKRLSSEDRKTSILEAVTPVFAAKGFHQVTTKELAAAAGVSEALLYKHFPSKTAMYEAIGRWVHQAHEESADAQRFRRMPPSTAKLVLGVDRITRHMVLDIAEEELILPRLMTWSLLGDGGFARQNLARFREGWLEPLADCLRAAIDAGDADDVGLDGELAGWLMHHLGFALKVLAIPDPAAVAYPVKRERVADEAVRFVLRGLGVRQRALETL